MNILCYGLNCVPPKVICWSLNRYYLRRWLFGDSSLLKRLLKVGQPLGWALVTMTGAQVRAGNVDKDMYRVKTMWRQQEEEAHKIKKKMPQEKTQPTPWFLNPRTWRNRISVIQAIQAVVCGFGSPSHSKLIHCPILHTT